MLSENEAATNSRDNGFGPLSRQDEVENWKINPLNSIDNIRKWEQECIEIRNKPETDSHDADNTTTPTRRARRTRSTAAKTTTRNDGAINTTNKSPREDHLYDRFEGPRRYSEMEDYGRDTETSPQAIAAAEPAFDASSIPNNFGPPVFHTKEYASAAGTPRISAWEEAPSISFQKQFLW